MGGNREIGVAIDGRITIGYLGPVYLQTAV